MMLISHDAYDIFSFRRTSLLARKGTSSVHNTCLKVIKPVLEVVRVFLLRMMLQWYLSAIACLVSVSYAKDLPSGNKETKASYRTLGRIGFFVYIALIVYENTLTHVSLR